MKFHRVYRYELDCPEIVSTPIVGYDFDAGFIRLSAIGELTVRQGYSWDGPSGPAVDTPSFMRASLIHDALYQLMREGRLGRHWRGTADKLMRQIAIEDGMWRPRAWWCWLGVRIGAFWAVW